MSLKLLHYMKKEDSGLARSTIEIAKAEAKLGHEVAIREPQVDKWLLGEKFDPDVHLVHSQLDIGTYYDGKPKFMWMHGEPISSVANGVSMKAICDLAPVVDAFICMRREEQPIWNAIRKTFYVPKGIDLEMYKPLPKEDFKKLKGSPAVLYYENWRGNRNPLYLCIAMMEVWKKFPDARLHLFNLKDKKMHETFKALAAQCKWSTTFLSTIAGPESDVNNLLNRADIVVSCLYPLYARGIEAFGAGKAFIGPGYREPDYPYTCELDTKSMATSIIKCWENYDKIDYRKWAETKHDSVESAKQAIEIYQRYS